MDLKKSLVKKSIDAKKVSKGLLKYHSHNKGDGRKIKKTK